MIDYVDVVIWAVYVLIALTAIAAIWSAWHGMRTHDSRPDPLATRHTRFLGYATAVLVIVVLAITFATASTLPIPTNGEPFTDKLWLRLTDMFICTSLLLILLCSVLVAAAKFHR